MNAVRDSLTPTLPWDEAKRARIEALAVEDAYYRDVWEPATMSTGWLAQSDPADIELERLRQLRCAADEVWMASLAPGLTEVIEKIEFARQDWQDFEGWPESWWNAVLADLRRLAGDEPESERDDAADFGPLMSMEEARRFRSERTEGAVAFLGIAMALGTRSRGQLLDNLRAIPTASDNLDDTTNCGMIEGFNALRAWLADMIAIVEGVQYRVIVVAEQVAGERGELEEAA